MGNTVGRNDLRDLFNGKIPDNNVKLIKAKDARAVFDDYNDSCYNITDDSMYDIQVNPNRPYLGTLGGKIITSIIPLMYVDVNYTVNRNNTFINSAILDSYISTYTLDAISISHDNTTITLKIDYEQFGQGEVYSPVNKLVDGIENASQLISITFENGLKVARISLEIPDASGTYTSRHYFYQDVPLATLR